MVVCVCVCVCMCSEQTRAVHTMNMPHAATHVHVQVPPVPRGNPQTNGPPGHGSEVCMCARSCVRACMCIRVSDLREVVYVWYV
jgi:hypothetical protein